MTDFEEKLGRYAELAVRFGVNIRPGQTLFMTADTASLPLVRKIAEAAYAAGAAQVLPLFSDDALTRARFEKGGPEAFDHAPAWLYEALARETETGRIARLAVKGETPGLLADIPADAVARQMRAQAAAGKPFSEAMLEHANWCVIAAATPPWAAGVFPEMEEGAALDRLWSLIFAACRLDTPDPVATWQRDFRELERRKEVLNAHAFDSLHFAGGGTDLTIGLAPGHVWEGAGAELDDGHRYAPNIPTEEVFTMPDRRRAEGRVVFTKPTIVAGNRIEGLEVAFSGGAAREVTATAGEEVVRDYLSTDEGAGRLGEVALVSNTSPVARTETLFLNTLFDENAACHIAFGRAYRTTLAAEADPEAAGMNDSQIHQDCMLGHAGLDVDGVDANGGRTAVMRSGEFVI